MLYLYCYCCSLALSNNDHYVTPSANLYHHWWNVAIFLVATIGQFYQTLTTTLLLQALRFITMIPILDALFWSWTLMTPKQRLWQMTFVPMLPRFFGRNLWTTCKGIPFWNANMWGFTSLYTIDAKIFALLTRLNKFNTSHAFVKKTLKSTMTFVLFNFSNLWCCVLTTCSLHLETMVNIVIFMAFIFLDFNVQGGW